jgi:hypothetical protein
MDTSRWLLLSIHSLNATVWLVGGILLSLFGGELESPIGGVILLVALIAKVVIWTSGPSLIKPLKQKPGSLTEKAFHAAD